MNWIDAIIHGIGLGLLLSVLIGPVFFLLIRISIEQGVKQALILDFGVITGDILYIVLSYLGTASIFLNPNYAKILGIIGGAILIITGIQPLFKKKPITEKSIELKTSNPLTLIIKGFILNSTNPFVIFFWIASVGYAVTTFDGNPVLIFIYFIACLLCYLFIDFIKIYTALKIRKYLSPLLLYKISLASGFAIALLGLIMMYRVYKL